MALFFIKGSVSLAAGASMAMFSLTAIAHAEARWDGLFDDGANVNWFSFRESLKPDSLQERGIQTDFSEEERFTPEFEINTFPNRIRRTLDDDDRNR